MFRRVKIEMKLYKAVVQVIFTNEFKIAFADNNRPSATWRGVISATNSTVAQSKARTQARAYYEKLGASLLELHVTDLLVREES